MRNITPEETKLYRHLISGRFSNFVLLATEFEDIETNVIASLEDGLTTKPLALLVNKEIFRRLKSPGETLVSGQTIILE